uniref:Uncharacterized protein n=1 Tax=Rhizophora mucronata TaxID=61149 RepID=A0A2P2L2G7_RHIMU
MMGLFSGVLIAQATQRLTVLAVAPVAALMMRNMIMFLLLKARN